MSRPFSSALLVSLALLAGSTAAGAQTAEDLLRAVDERHRSSLEGIDDLTIVQDLMGAKVTIHMEVAPGPSGRTLVTRSAAGKDGRLRARDVEEQIVAYLPWLAASRFEERVISGAVDAGRSEVGGRPARVVEIGDFWGFLFPTMEFLEGQDAGGRSVRLHIDAERLLPLRAELVDSAESPGTARDTIVIDFEAYQEVAGFRYPRRVVFEFSDAPIFGMGSEQMREQSGGPREGGIPGTDREGADSVALGIIERVERIEREGMVFLLEEVTVNTGPPPGGGPRR